jgi:hypothetical protein
MFDFLIGILRWKKTQLVMENLRLKWIKGKLLAEEVKALEEENKRLKEEIKEALRLRGSGSVAVLPSPVEVEKSEPERKEKREEKKEGKRTRWTEEERGRIKEWIKAVVSPLMVYERYVGEVKWRGKDYSLALCPFHNDSNPSLSIRERVFHCFGCGWEGDIFAFVMKRFVGLDFPQAVEKVVKDFSLALPQKSPVEASQRGGKGEGIEKSIASFSEASLGGGGEEKGGNGGGKKERGWRGATLEELSDYIGLLGKDRLEWLREKAKIVEGVAVYEDGKLIFREKGEGKRVLGFPYFVKVNGEWKLWRMRIRLQFPRYEGDDKGFRWDMREEKELIPYGLHSIEINPYEPYLFIVEGESDCLSLWRMGLLAVGLPGLGTWRKEWIEKYIKPIFGKRIIIIITEITGNEKEDEKVREKTKEIAGNFREAGYLYYRVDLSPYKDVRAWRLDAVRQGSEPKGSDLMSFIFPNDVEIKTQEQFEAWRLSWINKEKALKGGYINAT